jgi:hypothetical protein
VPRRHRRRARRGRPRRHRPPLFPIPTRGGRAPTAWRCSPPACAIVARPAIWCSTST